MPAPRFRVALASLLFVATAAAGERIELDAERSHAGFRVKLVWLVGIRGDFPGVQGTVDIDRFHNEAVVDAHIDARSVHMRVAGYAEWVRSPEFFDAGAHPDIHFVSQPFPLRRLQRGGELPGSLTLRGVTGPVRFTLEAAACARPGRDCPIVAHASVRRSAFGMRSRAGLLGDRVDLDLRVFAASDVDMQPP